MTVFASEKSTWNFYICHFTHRNLEKKRFHPWKFCKIMWHHFETRSFKTKTYGNSIWFFLTSLEVPILFLIDSWNFRMCFINTIRNFKSSIGSVWIFLFWTSNMCSILSPIYHACFQQIAVAVFKFVKLCLIWYFFYGLPCWNPSAKWAEGSNRIRPSVRLSLRKFSWS